VVFPWGWGDQHQAIPVRTGDKGSRVELADVATGNLVGKLSVTFEGSGWLLSRDGTWLTVVRGRSEGGGMAWSGGLSHADGQGHVPGSQPTGPVNRLPLRPRQAAAVDPELAGSGQARHVSPLGPGNGKGGRDGRPGRVGRRGCHARLR